MHIRVPSLRFHRDRFHLGNIISIRPDKLWSRRLSSMSADARHHVGKNTNKRRKDPTTVVAITERNSICKSRKQKSKVTEAEEEEEEAEEAMEWRRQGTPDILDGPMPQQVVYI
ncbi:hypothetical protein V1477_019793 [Vespula maculifrons]|uniref:Uncharacterized protein n=1 Tax=Vespula maculifrons TaxID=7453 RepID=A0ABD2AS99_VESMC